MEKKEQKFDFGMYICKDIWYDNAMRQKIRFYAIILSIMTLLFCAAGFPCAASSPAPSAIHSVAISPGSAVVAKNASCTFTASVTGENDYSSEVVWSVSGQTSQSTFIDSKGVLNVAADEGAASLVVKAVSRQDSAYFATALAVVQNATYRVNITVNDANGGTVTEGKTVNAGENMTIKATPKEGWRFVEWRENDRGIGNNQEMTLEKITGDRNLTAVFEKEAPKTYTITASVSSAGGIITPTGASPVPTGSWLGYAITPDRGYRIRMVYVDGTAIGAATSYNFTDVHGDHTISAEFEPDPAQANQNQPTQNGQANGSDADQDAGTNRTDNKKTDKNNADNTTEKGKTNKNDSATADKNTSKKTSETSDFKSDKEAAQKEKEAAAKAEREKMEQERMAKEQEEANRAARVELEKEKAAKAKADAEKAERQQEEARKQRQQKMVFGIVAAVIASCALGVFLVMRKRRG